MSQPCPSCGEELSVLLFMSVQPEFLVCDPCGIAIPVAEEKSPSPFMEANQ